MKGIWFSSMKLFLCHVHFNYSVFLVFTVHLKHVHEYSVQVARLWFYLTSSLCFKHSELVR